LVAESTRIRAGPGHTRYSRWFHLVRTAPWRQIKEKCYHSTCLAITDRSCHLQIQYKQHHVLQVDRNAWSRLLSRQLAGGDSSPFHCAQSTTKVLSAIQGKSFSFSRCYQDYGHNTVFDRSKRRVACCRPCHCS